MARRKSQWLEEKENLSGRPSSSTGELHRENSENKSTRKRSISVDGDEEGKRKRSENAVFECTLCTGKYQKEWTLFRHYRLSHKKESPERVHRENLAKRAQMKKSSGDKSENEHNCELCEAAFNSACARNSHYTIKHQIKDENLLFFLDGSALVESSLEYLISKNPQLFKIIVKRNMPARVCKLCEVELDMDELKCHYWKDHSVIQISKIKALIRLNDADIEQMDNTICGSCPDVFTEAGALENHVATVHAGLMECKICNKTFELKIYRDHVKNEHKDVYIKRVNVKNASTEVTEPNESASEEEDADETEEQAVSVGAGCVSFKPQPTQDVPLMYICDACNLVTSSYDNVIAHSQDHILNKVTKVPEVCEVCDLKFDVDFVIHKQMHLSNDDLDRDSFRFVSYDFKNLTNDKWLDMFNAFAKSKVKRIISASIYFSTRCIRLKLLRDCKAASAQFTLFQCLTCKNYVDPKSLESHVGQNSCINQAFSHQCVKCGKTFYTAEASDEHEKTHDIPDSESRYRTVLFNDPNDFGFNKALLENGGKGALLEKEVTTTPPERRLIDKDAAETPAKKVTVVTSETNKADPQVVTDKNKVVNEHEGVTDGRNKVANKHEMTNETNATHGNAADVYKCSCGLCFDRFNFLLIHMQNCSDTTKMPKITCACGLVFDRQNFAYHCKVHCRGVTTFNVKRFTLVDDTQIDVSGMTKELKDLKLLMKAMEVEDVNLEQHEKVTEQINSAD